METAEQQSELCEAGYVGRVCKRMGWVHAREFILSNRSFKILIQDTRQYKSLLTHAHLYSMPVLAFQEIHHQPFFHLSRKILKQKYQDLNFSFREVSQAFSMVTSF